MGGALLSRWRRAFERLRRDNPFRAWLWTLAGVVFGILLVWDGSSEQDSWPMILVGIGAIVGGLFHLRELLQPLPPLVHEVAVQRDPPHSWAVCSCGWIGEEGKSLSRTVDAAHEHARGGRVVVEDPPLVDPAMLGNALVSRPVSDGRKPVRVMFREDAREPRDSGWRMYSGEESPCEASAAAHMVSCPIAEVVADDSHIVRVLDTSAPCAFQRECGDEPFRRTQLRFKGIGLEPDRG